MYLFVGVVWVAIQETMNLGYGPFPAMFLQAHGLLLVTTVWQEIGLKVFSS
jgi:hypothetical protein